MTSPLATNAVILNANDVQYYLRATKEGQPLDGQIPTTTQTYTGVGGVTIVPTGANNLHVSGPLTGPLVINCTSRFNFINRTLMVTVAPGVGQSVTISLPAAPYLTHVKGSAAAVITHVLAASANAQEVTVQFRPDGAFIRI